MTGMAAVDVSRALPLFGLDSGGVSLQRGDPAVSILTRLLTDAAQALNDDHATLRTSLSRAVALLAGERRSADTEIVGSALAPWQAKRAQAYIDAHLDGPIRIEDLSSLARLSKSYFSRAFKKTFGRAPRQFILARRVARARELMMGTDTPLCEIAVACGFSDQAHFSRVFHRSMGAPPHAWRRASRPEEAPSAWRGALAA